MRIPVELVGLRPSRISPRHKYELPPKRSRCEDKNETKTATRTSSLMTLGVEFIVDHERAPRRLGHDHQRPQIRFLRRACRGRWPYQRRPPRERQRDAERVSKISASAWRRPTLASRFLSEQVGVRQASQIGFSKPPFSESLVDDLRSLSCLTYRLTGIRCYSPKFSGSHSI